MVAKLGAGSIDMVFGYAMDRISRIQADIATLYERLRFRRIHLVTRKEGEVGSLQIGMMGTINAELITAISEQTRD